MWRLIRRTLIVVALVVSTLSLLVASTPQGRAAVRTVLFIPQVLPAIPVKPQQWVTRAPVHEEIEFPIAGGVGTADLYLPAGSGTHSAVLFFMGVVPPDRDEERIVRLSKGLARAGMIVMVPWLDSQTQNRIAGQDIDSLVRAFQHLRSLDRVAPDRVGVGGICTGASLVTVAAQDERIRDHVKFVNFFAGYYDAVDMVKAITTRSRFHGEDVGPWTPDSLTERVFTYQMVEGVPDPADRELLSRVFKYDEAATGEEIRALSSEGTAVYRLLKGVPIEEADELIAQLSAETHDFLRLISPSTNIDKLRARVLIMHDRADELVPSEESRRLTEGLGEDNDTYHTEFSLFRKEIQVHVDESQSIGPVEYAREAFKLFLHVYNVIREIS